MKKIICILLTLLMTFSCTGMMSFAGGGSPQFRYTMALTEIGNSNAVKIENLGDGDTFKMTLTLDRTDIADSARYKVRGVDFQIRSVGMETSNYSADEKLDSDVVIGTETMETTARIVKYLYNGLEEPNGIELPKIFTLGSCEYQITDASKAKLEVKVRLIYLLGDGTKYEAESGCEHSFIEDTENLQPATCETNGQKTYVCEKCGETKTEAIAKLGHELTYQHDENQHWQKCTRNGCNYMTSYAVHDTNGANGACSVCGYTAGSTPTPDPTPTPSGGGGGGGGGGGSTTTATIPAFGDTNTIQVPVTVSGEKASLSQITESDLQKIISTDVKSGLMNVDMSKLSKGIDTLEMKTSDFKKVADSANDAKNDVEGLKVLLPEGSVSLDSTALASVANQAAGDTLSLKVARTDSNSGLNNAQKVAISSKENKQLVEAYVLCNGKRISDFGGGTATVSIPYSWDGTGSLEAWYVNDNGQLESVDCTYKDGNAVLTLKHFSYYIINTVGAGDQTETQTQTESGACDGGVLCPSKKFKDVDQTKWYHSAVDYAIVNNLFNGTSATTFEPNTAMTRGMFVTVLYRMENQPAVSGSSRFSDIPSGKWYSDAVIWADANGIVTGYTNGSYGPDDKVTREQMAAIMLRYSNFKKYDTSKTNDLSSYTDRSSIGDWALPAVQWANANGYVAGRTETTIAPKGNATRAEVATVLMRFIQNTKAA